MNQAMRDGMINASFHLKSWIMEVHRELRGENREAGDFFGRFHKSGLRFCRLCHNITKVKVSGGLVDDEP